MAGERKLGNGENRSDKAHT